MRLKDFYTPEDAAADLGGEWVGSSVHEQSAAGAKICSYALASLDKVSGEFPTLAISTTEFKLATTAQTSLDLELADPKAEARPIEGLGDGALLVKTKPEVPTHDRLVMRTTSTVIGVACKLSCTEKNLPQISKKILARFLHS